MILTRQQVACLDLRVRSRGGKFLSCETPSRGKFGGERSIRSMG